MRREFVKPWVDALRSGEYTQAQGRLCDSGAFCCLGVLTDLVSKTKPEIGSFISDGQFQWGEYHPHKEAFTLPVPIMEAADITDSTGTITLKITDAMRSDPRWIELLQKADINGNYITTELAELNDNGFTFAEIADIIESEWEIL